MQTARSKLPDHFRWCSNDLGAESYPETKRKEIYSVMRKIAAAIPYAAVCGENQLLFLQDTNAVVEAVNHLWRVGVTYDSSVYNYSPGCKLATEAVVPTWPR